MRVSIIPEDGVVSIDGVSFDGLDLSSIDPSVHAVQWYDTDGEVEIKDNRGQITENKAITSFDEYAFVISLWEAAKSEYEKQQAILLAEIQNNVANSNL